MKIKRKKELCQVFGVSLTTIDAWLRKGMPHKITKNGGYEFELDAVIKWREAYLQEAKRGNDAYEAARTEKEVYRAKMAKLNYERMDGSLIPIADVKKISFESGRMTRDSILNIPARLSPILAAERDSKKVHELLTNELRQCLENLANKFNTELLQKLIESEVKNDTNSN